MVKGLERFKEYFKDYPDQYVLIGGAACDISFEDSGEEFRVTKDLDIVLVVEALTQEFGKQFWRFIQDGVYQHRAKSTEDPQFYRFEKPENPEFPKMLELFARSKTLLQFDSVIIPLHIDDSVSSLSAILLNDDYYQLLLNGRTVINGVSVLSAKYLIPFKAKAWLDLREKQNSGIHVDSRDIKKHRNDILRIASGLSLGDKISLPMKIKTDMDLFVQALQNDHPNLKSLGLRNVKIEDIISLIEETYCL